jgi:hypothetical protein
MHSNALGMTPFYPSSHASGRWTSDPIIHDSHFHAEVVMPSTRLSCLLMDFVCMDFLARPVRGEGPARCRQTRVKVK